MYPAAFIYNAYVCTLLRKRRAVPPRLCFASCLKMGGEKADPEEGGKEREKEKEKGEQKGEGSKIPLPPAACSCLNETFHLEK
jgi:hypothetical protein